MRARKAGLPHRNAREKKLLLYFETRLPGKAKNRRCLSSTLRLPKPFTHKDAARLIREGVVHFDNGMYSLVRNQTPEEK